MNNRTNFIKRIEPKPTSQVLNVQKLKQESKSQHNSQHRHVHLRKSDIGGFQLICIFDKKIIVTFHHDLQMFGYFDFHAIHERIRYEYYRWKLTSIEHKITLASPFDEEVVEKEGKAIKDIYGAPRKVLLRVKG